MNQGARFAWLAAGLVACLPDAYTPSSPWVNTVKFLIPCGSKKGCIP